MHRFFSLVLFMLKGLAVQDLTFKLFGEACLLIIVSFTLCMVKLPSSRQQCQACPGGGDSKVSRGEESKTRIY